MHESSHITAGELSSSLPSLFPLGQILRSKDPQLCKCLILLEKLQDPLLYFPAIYDCGLIHFSLDEVSYPGTTSRTCLS